MLTDSKDKFSNQASDYYKFRPHYPDLLYQFLYSKVNSFGAAWDCGTGNGQVAVRLAEKFQSVSATDISAKQLEEADKKDNIQYLVARAEQTPFEAESFDLITVAQAVHWFDLDAFYEEVRRVAKPGAVIALWGYNLLRVSSDIDKVIDVFYQEVLGSYWDIERRIVEDEFRNLNFPFESFDVPRFDILGQWSFEQLIGFFNSWSAVQNYIEKNGRNPVDELAPQIQALWNSGESKKVRFGIFSRMGYVTK
jgi:SAM-dependent methyltransferase